MHFLRPPETDAGMTVDWSSGLRMLYDTFFDGGPLMLDSFVSLLAVGLFLGVVRERTGNIALCLGLHAGWIFVIKIAKHLTDSVVESPLHFLIGPYDKITGWLAAGWILLLTIAYRYWHSRRGNR